jgi:hypothetical protein
MHENGVFEIRRNYYENNTRTKKNNLDTFEQTANQAMDFGESAEPTLSECIETEEE